MIIKNYKSLYNQLELELILPMMEKHLLLVLNLQELVNLLILFIVYQRVIICILLLQ